MITIEHLKKEYPNVTPLKDVNAVIRKGDVISIIGPSGTGKSTLIRCLNQLEIPTSGRVIVDGEDITGKNCRIDLVRRKMGMVFQSFYLFDHLTVIENIMMAPMDLLHKSKQEAYDRGMELLAMVGLSSKALNYPDELSGGQKQRVAIARALAMDPEIILFDEPTSALDPTMVGEVLKVIRDLARQGLTMMIVTHEMHFAREVANRVFYMDEGGIYEEGTPEEIFDHPKKEKTRRFIRQLKVLEYEITKKDMDLPALVSELYEYGRKHLISGILIRKLHAVFEELVVQILQPLAADESPISFTAEYSAQENEIAIHVRYGDKTIRLEDSRNELAKKIILAYTSDYSWTELKDGPFHNYIYMKIR